MQQSVGEQNLRVVITGAASGLGRIIAQRFITRGARVFIGDIDGSALRGVIDESPAASGRVCDVGDANDVSAFMAAAFKTLGGIDALVNNVGIPGPVGAIEDCDQDHWERSVEVNLFGAARCIRAIAPAMKAQGEGSIVNISTGSTRTTPPGRTAYVAAKAGLEGMTRSLARELGPHGVRCNAILPGPMRNERMMRVLRAQPGAAGKSDTDLIAEMSRCTSLRRFVEMDEVAAMAVFLCTSDGGAITGQLIGVDAGMEFEE